MSLPLHGIEAYPWLKALFRCGGFSKDGIAPERAILDNRSKLPVSTKWVRIEGANQAQFGYYGFQLGEDQAEINREKQQAETIKPYWIF